MMDVNVNVIDIIDVMNVIVDSWHFVFDVVFEGVLLKVMWIPT